MTLSDGKYSCDVYVGSSNQGSSSVTNPSNGALESSNTGGTSSSNQNQGLGGGSGSNGSNDPFSGSSSSSQNFGTSGQNSGLNGSSSESSNPSNGSSSSSQDAISASDGSSSTSNVDADDDRLDIPSSTTTQKYKVLPGSLYQCPRPGFYPYEANCKEFYVCLEVLPGILFAEQLYRCPMRYLFDEDTRRCQREEKVNCRKFSFNSAEDIAKENVLVVLERFLEPFFATPLNYRAAQTIYPRG